MGKILHRDAKTWYVIGFLLSGLLFRVLSIKLEIQDYFALALNISKLLP